MAKKIPELESLGEEVKPLVNALNDMGDVPCVLTLASFLDNCLASLLVGHFIPGGIAKNLLMGPLGTFHNRIDLCYCLRLITEDQHRNLDIMRGIRNDFAHKYFELSFDDPSVLGKCERLTVPRAVNDKEGKSVIHSFVGRDRFVTVGILLASWLLVTGRAASKGSKQP